MIVKNEENTLPRCLGSVKGFVDEIVVLDTGSTDKTPEIAEQFGAKVYHFTWNNNFSSARNQALKYVTGDWILVLDADETLTSEIIPLLKSVLLKKEYLVINLVRQEVGSTQSPYSLVSRLFRNHPNIYFDRPYHALIDDSVTTILTQEPCWEVGYLPGVAIVHTGYQKSVINALHKYSKAAAAMEEFFANHPHDAYVCSKLGALYVQNDKINQGMDLLNRGLNQLIANEINQDINDDILYELHYHLGIGYTHLQDLSSAIDHYQAAVELPIYPLLKLGGYNNLGNLLKNMGDLQSAKIAYETAIKIDSNFVIGYYNLGMVCKAMGLFSQAIDCYNHAINLNPDYAEAYQNLGVVLLKIGHVSASLEAFEYAIALHELHNPEEAQRLHQGLQEMGLLPS
ncbi:MAG: glycosyltransferase [Dolichospermum sp.]